MTIAQRREDRIHILVGKGVECGVRGKIGRNPFEEVANCLFRCLMVRTLLCGKELLGSRETEAHNRVERLARPDGLDVGVRQPQNGNFEPVLEQPLPGEYGKVAGIQRE